MELFPLNSLLYLTWISLKNLKSTLFTNSRMVLSSMKQPVVLGNIQTFQGKEACLPRGQSKETQATTCETLPHTLHPTEKSNARRLSLHTHSPRKDLGFRPDCQLYSLAELSCIVCFQLEAWPSEKRQ